MPAVDDRLPPIEILRAEKLRRANERNRAASDQSIEAVQARCAQSLVNFVREAWHVLEPKTRYIQSWHVNAICSHLEAITDGRITRLLINVPPGPVRDDSLVETDLGPVLLRNIQVGNRVMTHLGRYRTVRAVHHQGVPADFEGDNKLRTSHARGSFPSILDSEGVDSCRRTCSG